MVRRSTRRAVQVASLLTAAGGLAYGEHIMSKVPVVIPGLAGGCAWIIDTGTVFLGAVGVVLATTPYLFFIRTLTTAYVVPALLAGGAICGWICPMGLIQDVLGSIGKRIGIVIKKPPLDEPARYIKWLILVAYLVAIPVAAYKLWYKICPMHYIVFTLMGWQGLTFYSAVKIGIAAILFLSGLVVPRGFCRYFCPIGVMFRLLNGNNLAASRIKKGEGYKKVKENCQRCPVCACCPMGITPGEEYVDGQECIMCLECVTCPVFSKQKR